jgi:hypothetical protein
MFEKAFAVARVFLRSEASHTPAGPQAKGRGVDHRNQGERQEALDSANVFNDSATEGAMATERTQPELASRDDRRRRRELNSLFWLCGWGGVTAFALIALTITSQTETANERLRRIFASGETSAIAGMPPRVAQLESETQLLVAQVRALTTERDRLSGRIALLESSIDDMSGAIKKQAAATAAVLAARVTRSTNCRGNGVTAY